MSKLQKKINIAYFTILSLVFFLSPNIARGMSISPLKQTLTVDAGSQQVVRLEVQETEEGTHTYVPSLDAFTIDSQTGRAIFGSRDDSKDWVQWEPASITLGNGQKGYFIFTISVPEGAEPGGHYLGLFAKEKKPDTNIGVNMRVGSLLFLTVSGEVREALRMDHFAPRSLFTLFPKASFDIDIYNAGTTHQEPSGDLVLYTMSGEEVARRPLNTDKRKILPGGNWQSIVQVPLDWKLAGRVIARTEITYGSTRQRIVDTTVLWYLPWQIFAVISFVVLSAGFWYAIQQKRKSSV